MGRDGVPDLMLGEYEVEGFQSLSSLLLMESPELDFESGVYELYSFGTEVIIRGGMDTSAQSIKLEQGQEVITWHESSGSRGNIDSSQRGLHCFY